MRVCPKWSGVAPCANRQKTAMSGLFSVGSKVGGRRLSSSLYRGVVKLVILFPDAISDDLHSTAHVSSDPVRLCSVHKIWCSCDQLKKKKKNRWVPLRAICCMVRKKEVSKEMKFDFSVN